MGLHWVKKLYAINYFPEKKKKKKEKEKKHFNCNLKVGYTGLHFSWTC